MNNINTTRNLLFKISKEDKNAFNDFFQLYYEKFFRLASQYVKGYNNVQDIVSDVFIKLLKKKKELYKIDRVEAYLFKMVKNQCLDFLKKGANKSLELLDEYEEHYINNSADLRIEIEGNELDSIIRQCVNALPPKRKIVYTLIKEHKLRHKEVADILNISPKTVEAHVDLAVKNLREVLTLYYKDSEINIPVRSIKSIKK